MSDRTFIDTHLFVYADDAGEATKRATAQRLIRQLAADQCGVLSTQVLMEYVAAARKKLGLSLADCRQAVLLMSRFDVVMIRPDHILGALDLASTHALSHWDALIVKTASTSGCSRLLTEDLQHGQVIDGIRIENPFI